MLSTHQPRSIDTVHHDRSIETPPKRHTTLARSIDTLSTYESYDVHESKLLVWFDPLPRFSRTMERARRVHDKGQLNVVVKGNY